jgi:Tol biopolymer transport system component
MFPFWSPDGARLYYIAEHNGRQALWSINIAGGTPEAELDNVAQAAISPDGRMLALLRQETGSAAYSLWTASPPASAPQRLRAAGFDPGPLAPWSCLRFAPDSSALGLWAARLDGKSAFWLIRRDGTAPVRLFQRLAANPLAQSFSWLPDSKRILFAEAASLSSAAHLWLGTTRSGELAQITNGPAREEFPSASPSGLDAAFNLIDARYELRNISLGSGGAPVVMPSTTRNTLAPAWSPDGRQLAYVTDRAGLPEIRIRSGDGAWERTAVGAEDFGDATCAFLNVAFSPGGQSIAYIRRGGEGEQIWISAIGGAPPHRMANDQMAPKRGLSWSPDGNWLAYATVRDGHYVLMRASVGSDQAEMVCRDCGAFPAWSPRGGEIAAINGSAGILLAAVDGSSVRRVGGGQWLALTWTRDGSYVMGIARTDEGRIALVEVAPRDGKQSVIEDLGPWPAAFSFGLATGMDAVSGISVAADERAVTYAALNVSSDVWLLKGLSEPGLVGRWRR